MDREGEEEEGQERGQDRADEKVGEIEERGIVRRNLHK